MINNEAELMPGNLSRVVVAVCDKCGKYNAMSVANTPEDRMFAEKDMEGWRKEGRETKVVEYDHKIDGPPEWCDCPKNL